MDESKEEPIRHARGLRQRRGRILLFSSLWLAVGLEHIPREFGPIPPFKDVLESLQVQDVKAGAEGERKTLLVQGELAPAEPALVKSMGQPC